MKSPLEQFDIFNIKLVSFGGVDFSLNNILIPSCHQLPSLTLDFCSYGQHIYCQCLFYSRHISN